MSDTELVDISGRPLGQRYWELQYDDTGANRHRKWHGGITKHASAETYKGRRDRVGLMWDARDLERNGELVKGILDRTVRYTLGALNYEPNSGSPKWDEACSRFINEEWAYEADVSGLGLLKFTRLMLRGFLRDGDSGAIEHLWATGAAPRYQLQLIEADRIGNPTVETPSEEIISGIHIDERGRRKAYDIFKGNSYGVYKFEKTIPARDFIHLLDPMRYGEYRGRSWLAPARKHLRDLKELVEYDKAAAKYAESFAAFIVRNNPGHPAGSAFSKAGTESNYKEGFREIKSSIGTVQEVTGGDGEMVFPPGTNRPGPAFLNLFTVLMRSAAVDLGLPYGFIWDISELGGVNSRIEAQQAQRAFQYWQDLLEHTFLRRVVRKAIMVGVASGRLKPHKNQFYGNWLFGPWITADIGHENEADMRMMAAGLMSEIEFARKRNRNYADIVRERGKALQIRESVAAEIKRPIEAFDQSNPEVTQQIAAAEQAKVVKATEGEPQPPEPVDPTVMKQFFETCVKPVLEDGLDRETAIAMGMRLLGWPYGEVEPMVPVVEQDNQMGRQSDHQNGNGVGVGAPSPAQRVSLGRS